MYNKKMTPPTKVSKGSITLCVDRVMIRWYENKIRKQKSWRKTKNRTIKEGERLAKEFQTSLIKKHNIWNEYIIPIRKEKEAQYKKTPEQKKKNAEYNKIYTKKPEVKTRIKNYNKKPEVKTRRNILKQAKRDEALKNKTYYCEDCCIRFTSKANLTRHNKTNIWHINTLRLKNSGFQAVINELLYVIYRLSNYVSMPERILAVGHVF